MVNQYARGKNPFTLTIPLCCLKLTFLGNKAFSGLILPNHIKESDLTSNSPGSKEATAVDRNNLLKLAKDALGLSQILSVLF